jgi:hypothetical protein
MTSSQNEASIRLTKPARIALVSIPLQAVLAGYGIYMIFADPANQRIFVLLSLGLLIGFVCGLVTVCRQRVTLYSDRLEFQALWDCGSFKRDEIQSVKGFFRTRIYQHNGHVSRLPYIRNLTPAVQAWLAQDKPDAT